MFNKELVRNAHKETKKMKKEFPNINYQFQFGLEMKYLLSKTDAMINLIGSPKQVAWAEKIKEEKMTDWKKEQEEMENAPNQKYVDELTAAVERILAIENATNWIDIKDHSIISLARADMKNKLDRYCFDIGNEKAFANRY